MTRTDLELEYSENLRIRKDVRLQIIRYRQNKVLILTYKFFSAAFGLRVMRFVTFVSIALGVSKRDDQLKPLLKRKS